MISSASDVKVVVADDHPIVRLSVAESLRANPAFEIVAAVSSGSELLDELSKRHCDMIVTDFMMQRTLGDEDGLVLIQRLKRLYPKIPIVVFTMVTNGGVLQQLCRFGVTGIVGKDEDSSILVETCFRALAEKRTILSPGIKARLAREGSTANMLGHSQPLSSRELEVVRLFADGVPLTEIAQRLQRSLGTVATQKRSAMRKLHVATNADLVKYAVGHGLT